MQLDRLAENARELGEFFVRELRQVAAKYPGVIREVRGIGLMIGIEFSEVSGSDAVKRLHENGLLAIPAGTSVVRLLPALNLSRADAEEGVRILTKTIASFAK
jgi:acetylornithine/succinyldiaminopimelate/putrescine aminotransferase